MELDVQSRAWIMTFNCDEASFTEALIEPLKELGLTRATGILSRTNGTASWFTYHRYQVRASAITSRLNYDQLVVKRTTCAQLTDFVTLPFDRMLELDGTLVKQASPTNELKQAKHCESSGGEASDEEFRRKLKRRRQLKRRLTDVDVMQRELKLIEDSMVQQLQRSNR